MNDIQHLDDIDREILRVLLEDARTPNSRIAERVGIAPSTAHARLRSLTERGVIEGTSVRIDPKALGHQIQAMIAVKVHAGARAHLRHAAARLAQRPEVLDIFFLAGPQDFLIHVAVADTEALREFVTGHLSAQREVAHTETSLVFEHLKAAGSTGAALRW